MDFFSEWNRPGKGDWYSPMLTDKFNSKECQAEYTKIMQARLKDHHLRGVQGELDRIAKRKDIPRQVSPNLDLRSSSNSLKSQSPAPSQFSNLMRCLS
jgi:hypothetical protein